MTDLSRRKFLINSTVLGCSAAASPLLAPVTLAQAPWENRLIVIILRGGMDGLDVVQPYGDPALGTLRKSLVFGEDGDASDLDGYFSMHPALAPLKPLWDDEDLAFTHAVSTPYRDKRSHFDGQDILEAGSGEVFGGGVRGGWLNRMLQEVPDITAQTTYAVGREQMLLTSGAAPVSRWSPEAELNLSPQAKRLLELIHHSDPLFQEAATDAIAIAEEIEMTAELAEEGEMMMAETPMMNAVKGGDHVEIAEFVADRLRGDARIAAFSLNGWDTHSNQRSGLRRSLKRLSDTILTLRARLGPAWQSTAIVAMTEFGRTARENGTKGTDHGTGGAMLMAGGAVRGKRVITDWPGLGDGDLYDGRDLLPTRDVRAHAAWAMRGLFGLETQTLEQVVFPGLDLGSDPGILL